MSLLVVEEEKITGISFFLYSVSGKKLLQLVGSDSCQNPQMFKTSIRFGVGCCPVGVRGPGEADAHLLPSDTENGSEWRESCCKRSLTSGAQLFG